MRNKLDSQLQSDCALLPATVWSCVSDLEFNQEADQRKHEDSKEAATIRAASWCLSHLCYVVAFQDIFWRVKFSVIVHTYMTQGVSTGSLLPWQ